jgi:tRNA pseudouridine38-40 synthase
MRYKLTISYDGTNYCGWQVQANSTSIQSLVQKALQTVLRHPTDLTGSGRTDSGVHALGQTAHFDTDTPILPARLLISLNALLPPDIRILNVEPVHDTFHARYSATGKIYHYHLHLSRTLNLLTENAKHFIGTHDFTSFANVKEETTEDTIRTIKRLDIVEQKNGVRLEFEGDGFLYKMVRNITGTLLDIASGKEKDIPTIFAAKDRRMAGQAAEAKGLFLMKVVY